MSSKARELANLGNAYSDGALSNRNLIINGAMQVAQRGTSKSVTGSAFEYNTLDRIRTGHDTDGGVTYSQDTDAPSGFASSIKVSVDTADASLASGQLMFLNYNIEGQDLQRLKFGNSDANSITVSFYVKSNKTANYALLLNNNDNNRDIASLFSINTANTWEYKTITFSGDTVSGFDNDNNNSLRIYFWLAGGSTYTSGTLPSNWQTASNANKAAGIDNFMDSTSNYINITGVQLEVGDTATPFEHRSYGQELALCQRYYMKPTARQIQGVMENTTAAQAQIPFFTEMRAAPTITRLINSTWGSSGGALTNTAGYNFSASSKQGAVIALSFTSSSTVGIPITCETDGILELSAEL